MEEEIFNGGEIFTHLHYWKDLTCEIVNWYRRKKHPPGMFRYPTASNEFSDRLLEYSPGNADLGGGENDTPVQNLYSRYASPPC